MLRLRLQGAFFVSILSLTGMIQCTAPADGKVSHPSQGSFLLSIVKKYMQKLECPNKLSMATREYPFLAMTNPHVKSDRSLVKGVLSALIIHPALDDVLLGFMCISPSISPGLDGCCYRLSMAYSIAIFL